MKKRSISFYGHQTSVALEPEFWAVIDAAVAEKTKASRVSFANATMSAWKADPLGI